MAERNRVHIGLTDAIAVSKTLDKYIRVVRPADNPEDRLVEYLDGFNDQKIAEMHGCKKSSVAGVRMQTHGKLFSLGNKSGYLNRIETIERDLTALLEWATTKGFFRADA